MGQSQQYNNTKEYEECAGHCWKQLTVTVTESVIGQGGTISSPFQGRILSLVAALAAVDGEVVHVEAPGRVPGAGEVCLGVAAALGAAHARPGPGGGAQRAQERAALRHGLT